mgnify:CR=1 FL=1
MSKAVHWYFAYGSNMNPARVEGRQMGFQRALAGTLSGFELQFNKRSTVHQGMASANVVRQNLGVVEGVLYQLSAPDQILQMDPFEGYPERYVREACAVQTKTGPVEAWVYIATQKWISEGLRPARWYLDHLLAGRAFLTEAYFEALSRTECLPDSSVEPT